jgi:hypothetical protein
MRTIIAKASESPSAIVAVTAVLDLRIGETLGVGIQDLEIGDLQRSAVETVRHGLKSTQ